MGEPFETEVRVPLRWSDVDSLGHVNSASYHEFLEEARSLLFEGRQGADEDGWVIRRVELDHLGELSRGEGEVIVRIAVLELSTSSATVRHDILTPGGRLIASGRSVVVAWDQAKRGKRPISERERIRLLGEATAQEGLPSS